MQKSILNINKRHFSTTLARLTDSSDIFARLDALIKGNKEQLNGIKSILNDDKARRIKEEIIKLDKETELEEKKMKEHLKFLVGRLSKTTAAEDNEASKYHSDYLRLMELINNKKEEISQLDRNNPDYLKKVFDIVKFESKVINDHLNKIEDGVNKLLEKDRAEKHVSTDSASINDLAIALRLKERKEYFKKEQESYEKINKEFESKKETPTEYVQSLSETEMPSYMDPED